MLAHAPVAGSRTEPQPSPGLQQQPVQNPAAALCPLATASPRTASLFPTSFKLPEPFGEKKKKPESGPKSNFPGSNACDHRGNRRPEHGLAAQGRVDEQRQPRSTTEARSTPSPIFYWPNTGQQLFIGTLTSSVEGNETEGHFSKLAQVRQREVQWGEPALKEVHSPLIAQSFPKHFGF